MEDSETGGALVSFVVVSYNHGQYIRECLNSIKAQRYTNWELILADDCSNDNSVQVYENWLQENREVAKRIFHSKNAGFCRTLNECIAQCEGTYIKILAADDFLHPDLLLKSLNTLEESGKDYGLVFANAEFVDGASMLQGKYLIEDVNSCPRGEVFRRLLAGNFIPALTVVIKKSVFDVVGPFDESIWIEDWEYWLRASKQFKFAFVPEVLAYYRRHDHNVSSNRNMVLTEWKILLKHDQDGLHKKELNAFAESRFFIYNAPELRAMYRQYPHRDRLLYYSLKFRLPWFAYNVLRKIRL